MNYKIYYAIKEAKLKIRTISFQTLYFLFTPIRKLMNWCDDFDNKFTRHLYKRRKTKEALTSIYTGLKYNNIASFTDDNTISFLKYDLGIDHMSDVYYLFKDLSEDELNLLKTKYNVSRQGWHSNPYKYKFTEGNK